MNNVRIPLVAVAVFLFSYWQPLACLSIIVLYGVHLLIKRTIPREDRRFMYCLVTSVIVIKIIVLIFYTNLWLLNSHKDIIGPDGEGFSQRGWYIAKVLSGNVDYSVPSQEYVFVRFFRVVDFYKHKLPPFNSRANGLNTYFIGLIYYLFGYVPLFIKLLNVCLSAVSGIVLYKLGRIACGRSVGLVACLLFTFFPTAFIFSITALRDTLTILCIITIMYCLYVLRRDARPVHYVGLLACLVLMVFLREDLFLILMAISAFVLFIKLKLWPRLLFSVCCVSMVVAIVTGYLPTQSMSKSLRTCSPNAIARYILVRHVALHNEGGAYSYRILPDRYYDEYRLCTTSEAYAKTAQELDWKMFMRHLPKGILYYFALPWPFARAGPVGVLVSLGVLAWYALVLLAAFGLFRIRRFGGNAAMIAFVVIVVLLSALLDANGGILIRHRDMVLPFFVLWASCGIVSMTKKARSLADR